MIYLDNNATTRIDKRVYIKQCEVLNKYYGNPSSLYPFGVSVNNMIQSSRKKVATMINADLKVGDQIIFTSCATEGNNSVFFSFLYPEVENKHVIVSAVEHPSVLNTVAYYESIGCHVTYVGVDENGELNEIELLNSIRENTVLVSIMYVNSETGVINNIARIAHMVKEINPNIAFHTDAVQAAGKIPIDVKALGIDLLTISAHKFYGPKGVGALYIKAGIKISPFLLGGHQENGLRAGTENTASIVAMGEAASIVQARFLERSHEYIRYLRDKLETSIEESFTDAIIFGKKALRVGNTSNIGFKNINGVDLVLKLAKRDICISSGTACNSKSAKSSAVLRAMQVPEEYIKSIRISLSFETTECDIQTLLIALKSVI
ncbi:MAG: cysteine desulfurase [Oscillospiraceae bacterium]|nr:cysteine desulfurase [Oscillospiraceae bacterium]